ncbi:hypothetical protein B0T22DRAFT_482314 [Podospora appendiculata]|uniref:Uncharacterized protein n=1 Tax=Podospora appendiculata TaxID=314037 RepID=A0AAE1CAB6_9PEZI|nr:hypothetical protein B0T22DRAFT_482314 [Podospora appendiculata]
MSNQERDQELAEFIKAEVLRRRHVRSICPELLEIVKQTLIRGAQGMESFDRALARVLDSIKGRKLFEIVAGAARPMTLDEIRVAMNVQPVETHWKPETLIINGDALVRGCSGGLLEVDEEILTI